MREQFLQIPRDAPPFVDQSSSCAHPAAPYVAVVRFEQGDHETEKDGEGSIGKADLRTAEE